MRIAISGGIAEGKSTVLGYIRDLGMDVVSSDEIAREVLASAEVQAEIADLLGISGPPSREALRERIAVDPAARRALNKITHGRIVQAILEHPAPFVEVPLLIEACLYGMFDRVWIVTCGAEEQLARLEKRYGSVERAREIVSTQMPTEAKLAFADEIVRTNRPPSNVCEDVAGLVAAMRCE
jgi:dephospho-CoA kinase